MPTWKLLVEYDGTDFCGWQTQPNGTSVQSTLEEALSRLHDGETVKVGCAGRTDAGVHARGQVAAFTTQRELSQNSYERGLNTYLPRTCAVRSVERVSDEFDARRWARGKRYIYRILRSRFRSPLRERFTWLVHQKLDVAAMQTAARDFVGVHDFASLQDAACQAETTIRELRRCELVEMGDELVLAVEGTAFLKHMVRTIAGTLMEVGIGWCPPTSIPEMLGARDRTRAGRTAPPQGLCLDEVFYDMAAGPPSRDRLTEADE